LILAATPLAGCAAMVPDRVSLEIVRSDVDGLRSGGLDGRALVLGLHYQVKPLRVVQEDRTLFRVDTERLVESIAKAADEVVESQTHAALAHDKGGAASGGGGGLEWALGGSGAAALVGILLVLRRFGLLPGTGKASDDV